mmetsp:Transcript_166710/g.405139  ORF Transcript_166710/g.405139 Transcript_166710/m.405139 type:complete len:201 (-) Transcript_166710:5356-5958(-)
MLWYVCAGTMPYFSPILSSTDTTSEPADRMKKMGVAGTESARDDSSTSIALSVLSQSTKREPPGRVARTKLDIAVVRRSGRMHLSTSSFLIGVRSRDDQSRGSFSLSGDTCVNHSLKRVGASTRSLGSLANSSIDEASAWMEFQAGVGSQSSGFGSPGFRGPRTRKLNALLSKPPSASSPDEITPRRMSWNVSCARSVNL